DGTPSELRDTSEFFLRAELARVPELSPSPARNPMSWNQLTLDVPDDLIDAVVGELSGDGVAGVWESHAPETGVTRLVLYFSPRSNLEQAETLVRSIFQRSERQSPAISRATVEDCDWTEEWKKSYTSFPIGDDFFVIPSWENGICPD